MITSKKQFDSIINRAEHQIGLYPLNSESLYDLGFVFEFGLVENNISIAEIDYEQSFHWYERAMKKGNIDATLRLADFMSEGIGCKKNIEKAITLYLICIDKERSIAANNLATIFRDMKNYIEAFKYYKLANDLMSKEYRIDTYSLNVAMCYLYGIGVKQDIDTAVEQIKKLVEPNNNYSCQFDIDEANYLLGLLYLQGKGVTGDIDKARYYLLNANLEEDHPSSQALLLLIGRIN
ncbi:MAG: tetratricopeptide repeat protein [Dysgonomonas sp.]